MDVYAVIALNPGPILRARNKPGPPSSTEEAPNIQRILPSTALMLNLLIFLEILFFVARGATTVNMIQLQRIGKTLSECLETMILEVLNE